MQRLRYIRQLGFSYLVYPGAHHTRFEHSLGAMHLASLMSAQIGLPRQDHLMVMSAALLHDIGHGPFSHAIEGIASEVKSTVSDREGQFAFVTVHIKVLIPGLNCSTVV